MKTRFLLLGLVTYLMCSCGPSVDDLAESSDNIFIKRVALAITFSGSDTSDDDSSDDGSDSFKEFRKAFEECGLKVENIYFSDGRNPSIDVACNDRFGSMNVRMFVDEMGSMYNFYGALQFVVDGSFEDVTSQIENVDFNDLHKALLNSKEDIKDDYVLFNSIDPEYSNSLVNQGCYLSKEEPELYYEKNGKKELYVKRYYAITGTTIKIKVEEDGSNWGKRQNDNIGHLCKVTIGINKNVVEKM